MQNKLFNTGSIKVWHEAVFFTKNIFECSSVERT